MPRTYSEKFLRELSLDRSGSLGIALARLCAEANIPAAYAAVALDVSATAIYRWFRGRNIAQENENGVKVFMDFLNKDRADGILPAKNMKAARSYIEDLVGKKI